MTLPTFGDFYRAVHAGRDPFPWQSALSERVRETGWPDEIAIPTGLGKTSCIDVAVWAMAADAAGSGPKRHPTRVWYVVNRRLLVDAALDHGERLADLLRTARSGPLQQVADLLRSRSGLGLRPDDGAPGRDPLHVTRLRGGGTLGARPPEPSQPALLFATVPMFASRWLFSGYGTSAGMRPIDAAMAGIDALALLDEAHLARPLLKLRHDLAACDVGDPGTLLPPERARTRLVSMTATGDRHGDAFELGPDDLDHDVVQRRLRASKPATLHETTDRRLAETLAELAAERVDGTSHRCLVFANTTATAAATLANLQQRGLDAVLLTGRFREHDAAPIRERLLDPVDGLPSGRADARGDPLVVVATQTLEVGADLDADHLVTENAGVRALVQRLGRLNRLGDRNNHASVDVVHVPKRADWPVYGTEPAAVWERLRALAPDELDLGPASVGVLGDPSDQPERTGELLPAHLWECAKTSAPDRGRTPVELFFQGFDDDRRVSVLWRTFLPEPAQRLVPGVASDEVVDLPINAARSFLDELDSDGTTWRCIGRDEVVAAGRGSASLRPGDIVLLPRSAGGYSTTGGWDGVIRSGDVTDVSVHALGHLPLHGLSLDRLLVAAGVESEVRQEVSDLLADADSDDEETGDVPDRQIAEQLLRMLAEATPNRASDIAVALGRLDDWTLRHDGQVPVIAPPRQRMPRAHVPIDAFDDRSFDYDASARGLADHGGVVGRAAEVVAEALGLPGPICDVLARAGRLHDVGKADPRFQRRLGAPAGEPWAKSRNPRRSRAVDIASGWPRGGRHELLSGRAVVALLTETPKLVDDLLTHLVVSHHGGGRPLVGTVRHDDLAADTPVDVDGETVVIDGDLSRPDWEQPRRFRRLCEQYGYWGVALLEAIVRQADHAASEVADREGRT